MNDIQDVVDHAAVQSDRWMFVALLVLTIVGMVFFWRWLTTDRDKLATRLTEITDRHITAGEKLGEVVANNTVVMREVKDAIAYCRMRDRDKV